MPAPIAAFMDEPQAPATCGRSPIRPGSRCGYADENNSNLQNSQHRRGLAVY